MNNIKHTPYKLLILSLLLLSYNAQAKHVLENFQNYNLGNLNLSGWYKSKINASPHDIYQVAQEGKNKYLKADSNMQSAVIFRMKGWKLKNNISSWKWRVRALPKGAKPLLGKDKNNSAASVYIVFKEGSWLNPKFYTLKYVWATDDNVGDFAIKEGKHKQALIIQHSGKQDLNTWVTEKIDVVADYKKYFKTAKAKKPLSFGILSDSERIPNGTSAADYDDFTVYKGKLTQISPKLPKKQLEPVHSETKK